MGGFAQLHLYEDIEGRSAAMQMAVDEAMLESASAPSLRCYRWRQPSLSFGYFGSFDDVAESQREREIVRRWTGGGVVLHGRDLTYSVIIPFQSAERFGSARAIYREIHDAIRRTLSEHAVVLASEDAPKVSAACFANPVIGDVLLGGRKIAGAAQRRTRAGLLQQGSIQYEALAESFASKFASELCPHWELRPLDPGLLDRARELVEQKYGTERWLRMR